MKKILTIVICLSLSSTGFAKPKAYFDVKDEFFSPVELKVDDKTIDRSFWSGYDDLRQALKTNPKATELANDHVLYARWSNALLWGSLAGAVVYGTTTDEFDSGTYWGIFLAGFIPAIVLGVRSQQKLIRSLNHYNGIYSLDSKDTVRIGPANKGLGLALYF